MASKRRITKTVVDKLKPGEIVWDTEINGFGARCQKQARVYVLKTREGGRQRWFTLGRHGAPLTPDDARKEALSKLGAIADGNTPAASRDAAKRNPMLKTYALDFMRDHVQAKRKSRTADSYQDLLDRLIIPVLGNLKLKDVQLADVARLHRKWRRTPYQANRALALVSKMLNLAERDGFRTHNSNPCRHVEKFKEEKRERFLSEVELAILGEVLVDALRDRSENTYVVAAIRLLLFSGARVSEILGLRWEYVDFERAMLRLPDSKTGQKSIYLSAPALEVLHNLPRLETNPHVIVGDKSGAALVNIQKPWRRLRKAVTVRLWAEHGNEATRQLVANLAEKLDRTPTWRECTRAAEAEDLTLSAGLVDVRLHDLRHSFASVAATGGMSLPMIGKLLGHTQAATTHRYSHLSADPVRAANEAIGQRIAAMMQGKDEVENVVPLLKSAD